MVNSSRITSLVGALVLLLQIPSAVAGDGPGQKERRNGPVEITFTKWMLLNNEGEVGPLMTGYVGSAPGEGQFAGEVLEEHISPTLKIGGLEAIYSIRLGRRVFTALIRGGYSFSGLGILDGTILAGWRTGARVHVRFQQIACTEAPNGACFQGTIQVEETPKH
jgi:hypothetical protein